MATAVPEIPALARDRAFESLYRRYAKDVYRYALAVLRNPADAEDVTQTTFMNAYRAFQRGEHVEKPHNWLIKIAHNAARTRYARASRRVREVPLEDHLDQLAIEEDEKPDVHAVLEALGRLPMNQRAALVMRELEGRTYAEIADTLGVSVAAVETLIFRGRRSLRLKASSVRALGAVQLPASLTQLFGSGGGLVVAGGSATVGSGFLFKAALAIIAGVVATGVDGDHNGGTAAARVLPGATSLVLRSPAPKRASRSELSSIVAARHTGRPSARAGGNPRPGQADGQHGSSEAAVSASTSSAAAAGAAPGASQSATPQETVTTAATTTTQTVTSTLEPVTSTLPPAPAPALPVTVPQLPPAPVPVPLPPPPPLPPLP